MLLGKLDLVDRFVHLVDCFRYGFLRGQARDHEGFWTLAQELCDSMTGDDRDAVLCDIHCNLGEFLSFTTDNVAANKHKEALYNLQKAICASIGPDYVDERLGIPYEAWGDARIQGGYLEEGIAAHLVVQEI